MWCFSAQHFAARYCSLTAPCDLLPSERRGHRRRKENGGGKCGESVRGRALCRGRAGCVGENHPWRLVTPEKGKAKPGIHESGASCYFKFAKGTEAQYALRAARTSVLPVLRRSPRCVAHPNYLTFAREVQTRLAITCSAAPRRAAR